MKIYIKLTKAETERWNMLKSAVIGTESTMSDEEFSKIMLFRGINGFMDDLNKAMDEMPEEEKNQILQDAGVDTEVEVEVPVTPVLSGETDENPKDSDEQSGEGAESSSVEKED